MLFTFNSDPMIPKIQITTLDIYIPLGFEAKTFLPMSCCQVLLANLQSASRPMLAKGPWAEGHCVEESLRFISFLIFYLRLGSSRVTGLENCGKCVNACLATSACKVLALDSTKLMWNVETCSTKIVATFHFR